MKFDMVKFERGQVWMVYFKNQNSVGHEQNKNRPYLILSIGKFNKSSGMVTACPITTRNEARTPSQVLFENDKGEKNVILCEHTRSFDYRSNDYRFEYIGQLSDKVLEDVDVALSIHLGLHYSPITLKRLHDSMEAIVKSVTYMQNENQSKFDDNDVLEFAIKLEELASISKPNDEPKIKNMGTKSNPIFVTKTVDPNEPCVVIHHTGEPSIETSKNNKEVKEKKSRIKWTPKVCEEFLHDADTLPMKEVMEKWGISKKPRFYSMKNYAEGLITTKKTK